LRISKPSEKRKEGRGSTVVPFHISSVCHAPSVTCNAGATRRKKLPDVGPEKKRESGYSRFFFHATSEKGAEKRKGRREDPDGENSGKKKKGVPPHLSPIIFFSQKKKKDLALNEKRKKKKTKLDLKASSCLRSHPRYESTWGAREEKKRKERIKARSAKKEEKEHVTFSRNCCSFLRFTLAARASDN